MSTYYDKNGTAPTSAYIGELYSMPVLKVNLTEEGANKLAEMFEENDRFYTWPSQVVMTGVSPIEAEIAISAWKIIQEKKVDIFFDILKRDSYEDYCDYFNCLSSEGDPDVCVYKQLLTREEFELLSNSIQNSYIMV